MIKSQQDLRLQLISVVFYGVDYVLRISRSLICALYSADTIKTISAGERVIHASFYFYFYYFSRTSIHVIPKHPSSARRNLFDATRICFLLNVTGQNLIWLFSP